MTQYFRRYAPVMVISERSEQNVEERVAYLSSPRLTPNVCFARGTSQAAADAQQRKNFVLLAMGVRVIVDEAERDEEMTFIEINRGNAGHTLTIHLWKGAKLAIISELSQL